MERFILTNIKSLGPIIECQKGPLRGSSMDDWNSIEYAFLKIESGLIKQYGQMSDFENSEQIKEIDCSGKYVLPTFCDSHTHIIFAAYREAEFVQRIKGATYQEIAQNGGGILNSAKRLADMSESKLYEDALARLEGVIKTGTGAIEIKSGYGLSVDSELKMLRVAKRLKKKSKVNIKTTLLAAHAIPQKYKNNPNEYIHLIIEEIIPKVAEEGLADYIDVFCETGYFTSEQTSQILQAGVKYKLQPKIHTNQFTSIGGVQTAIKHKAVSVDHLEIMNSKDIKDLSQSNTMACVLPGCSFFLGIPFAPVHSFIENNISFAIASDFNPGSCPSGNMMFMNALACIKQKLTPYQVLNASMINGAYAMQLEHNLGSITLDKKANLIITNQMSSLEYFLYSFGESERLIDKIILQGEII